MATNRLGLKGLLLLTCIAVPSFAAAQDTAPLPDYVVAEFGQPPAVPEGPLSDELATAVQAAFIGSVAPAGSVSRLNWGETNSAALAKLVEGKDPRVVWLISDLMRFAWQRELHEELASAGAQLLGISFDGGIENRWNEIINHLMAWEIPAYPDYLAAKRSIYTNALPGWELLFVEGKIDWRMVSWGGVPIDPRPYDQTNIPCNCIPAADNPEVSSAEEATWLKDDDIVFGVEVNGEYRAYPRRIMEVREMVNDTLGGRHLGIPYCTLCGSAQAYFTDDVPEGVKRPVLRTSGLLIRSNKVMYDVETHSVFDTFLGNAVTGPLAEIGMKLNQATVITTDWGTWKATYPETTVLIEELALGRDFDFRNNRDADGPIFPVGDVDPRLAVQEDVIGAVTASGVPVAFPRGKSLLALQSGEEITIENVKLVQDAGGLRVVDLDGAPLPSHEAFWFAWSQFYPETKVWSG